MIAGAVLVGGRSRRMGRDKASIVVDGVTLVERALRSLDGAGAHPLVLVGDAGPARVDPPAHRVADRWPGAGPVGGVATALLTTGAPTVVLACDLPAVDVGTVQRLREGVERHPAADVVVARSPRGLEPLIACWRPSVAGSAAALLDRPGTDPAMSTLLDRLDVVEIPVPASVAVNVNRPGDLVRSGAGGAGVGTVAPTDEQERTVSVPEIDVDALAGLLPDAVLIDVREPDEYAQVRVPGGRLIPLGELGARLSEVPTEGTVYVVCRSGARSGRAVEALRAEGIDAVNVAGGTLAWVASGRDTEEG